MTILLVPTGTFTDYMYCQMFRESRRPQIGDMIIKCTGGNVFRRHIGLVHGFKKGKWSGHNEVAFITWSTDPPPDYNEEYGYFCTNIHNLRSEFKVIRNGINIP